MRKITVYIFAFLLSLSFINTPTFWDEYCGSDSGYGLYECRVEKVCKEFKSDKPVYTSEDYETADGASWEFHNQASNAPAFDSAKRIYRENMGNIYKCGIVQSQRNALEKLLDFIKQESSGKLSDTIGWQIQQQLSRIEIQSTTIWCSLTDTDSIQNKLNILKETSYEACRYVSYLEYSKEYYKNIRKFTPEEAREAYGSEDLLDKYPSPELPRQINKVQNEIAEEIAHTYKVFPIAFHAYSEYENNFPIHYLLQVIRADFLVLRTSLYQAIMPIAQVGLKVINAMSY